MELMLIVYLVSLLDTIQLASILFCVFGLPTMAALYCWAQPDRYDDKDTEEAKASILKKLKPWYAVVPVILAVFIPNGSTIKYMAGAYLLQSSYQSEFVQTALPLGQKAVLNQLKRWSEDSEELKDLLVEQVKEQK